MILSPANASDIQKYYESSYIKLRDFGDKVFFVNKVTRDGIYFTDCDSQEGLLHLHEDAPYNLDMVLPNKALFQLGNYCYSLARIPARQYHRGITVANCLIQRLDSEGWKKQGLSFTTLQGYMSKPNYRPLGEVIATAKHSEAVTSRFAYQASGRKIWCDNRIVGVVNPALKTIACNKLLAPEIAKLLADNKDYRMVNL